MRGNKDDAIEAAKCSAALPRDGYMHVVVGVVVAAVSSHWLVAPVE